MVPPAPYPFNPNDPTTVLLPMKLDAFVNLPNPPPPAGNVNPLARPPSQAYLASPALPDYSGLKPQPGYIQHDVLEPVDVRLLAYKPSPPERKAPNRVGIHLHWSVPRTYRATAVGSETSAEKSSNPAVPQFRPTPNRWIVHRFVKGLGTFSKWNHRVFMIESDKVRTLADFTASDDIAISATPYFNANSTATPNGDQFLGQAFVAGETWPGEQSGNENRAPVTVNANANPYFADYAPHNTSVFSFFDDLTIIDGGKKGLLQTGYVSYTVIGYHSNETQDPFYGQLSGKQARVDRSSQLLVNMEYVDSFASSWYKGTGPVRTFAHGGKYDIKFDRSMPKYPKTPADDVQNAFTSAQPLAVGTNVMDGLMAWIQANQRDVNAALLLQQLQKIQTLILQQSDDIDGQLEAQDLLATNNFIPTTAGVQWHLKPPTTQPGERVPLPTADQINTLGQMNKLQARVNILQRYKQYCKTQLFQTWWTYVSDHNNMDAMKQKVYQLKSQITYTCGDENSPNTPIGSLTAQIAALALTVPCIAGVEPPYYVQRDPTLFIAGLESAWPKDWNQDLPARIDFQNFTGAFQTKQLAPPDPNLTEINTNVMPMLAKAPQAYLKPISRTLAESLYFESRNPGSCPSYYYNQGDVYNDTQGWFPLFVEWEVEYYNIPFSCWKWGVDGDGHCTYRIKDNLKTLLADTGDFVVLQGRSALLPQASATLEASFKQIFAKLTPEELVDFPQSQQDTIIQEVKGFQYLSTAMDGLRNQLLTLKQGTHVKPLVFNADGTTTAVPAALSIASEIGITESDLKSMDTETMATPFASTEPVALDKSKYTPFKPVMHGQFRFTKLNIIDRFGQVVVGLPFPSYTQLNSTTQPVPKPLFPCLGDAYNVDGLNDLNHTANTVLHRNDSFCQFVQLPPSINQPARLKADYVTVDTTNTQRWRELDEWENPVLGWIIVNYPNYSFQIFSPDGDFITELSIATASATYHPFPPNDNIINQQDRLLRDLLNLLKSPMYLRGFFSTVSASISMSSATTTPSSYAQSSASILGRPLAIVKSRLQLQLADPPLTNQCTASTLPGPNLTGYNFNIKIGDRDSLFDGLIGYFTNFGNTGVSSVDIWNLQYFYSYNAPDSPISAGDPSRPMPTDSTTLPPVHTDINRGDWPLVMPEISIAALVDPFTPLNVYTAMLPLTRLSIPSWVIDRSLDKLASFYRIGPTIVPGPLPPYNAREVLPTDYKLDNLDKEPQSLGKIKIPSTAKDEWVWLQPYWDKDATATKYCLLDVQGPGEGEVEGGKGDVGFVDDGMSKPGMVVEGYLQMRGKAAA